MDIAMTRRLTAAQLQVQLRPYLSGLIVAPNSESWTHLDPRPRVSFFLHEDPPEFPKRFFTAFSVAVQLAEGIPFQHWLIELARLLSVEFECETLCDGTNFGPDDSPYWSILWNKGEAFLADDSETDRPDQEVGPIRIIEPLPHLDLQVSPGGLDDAVFSENPPDVDS